MKLLLFFLLKLHYFQIIFFLSFINENSYLWSINFQSFSVDSKVNSKVKINKYFHCYQFLLLILFIILFLLFLWEIKIVLIFFILTFIIIFCSFMMYLLIFKIKCLSFSSIFFSSFSKAFLSLYVMKFENEKSSYAFRVFFF